MEHLRANTNQRIIPCKVVVGKQNRCHGKPNDARNARAAFMSVSHLVSSTGVKKVIQSSQTENQQKFHFAIQLHIQSPDSGGGYKQNIKIADDIDSAGSVWTYFRVYTVTRCENVPQFLCRIAIEDLQKQHCNICADDSQYTAMK